MALWNSLSGPKSPLYLVFSWRMNLLLHCATQRYNRCNVTNICDITNCPSQHQQQHHAVTWLPGASTLYIQRAVHSQDGVASGAEIRHKWRLSIRYVHLLAHINVIVGWRGLEIPTIKDLHSNCEIIEASFIWNAIDRSAVWCGVDNRKYSDQCWAKPRYICKKLSPVPAFPAQSSSDCRKYLIETSCKQNLHIFSKAIGGRAA